jgi:hypothetical protein
MYLKLLAAYPSHFAHSFILYCIYLSIQQYSRTYQDRHTYIHLYEIMTTSEYDGKDISFSNIPSLTLFGILRDESHTTETIK